MEINKTSEPTNPLASNILSAIEQISVTAQHGREKIASRLKEGKIGMLGLSVGAAFFLAACSGGGAKKDTLEAIPAFAPNPVSEFQASDELVIPVPIETPDVKDLISKDVDTLMSTVKTFFREDYFKRMGYDLDEVSDKLKELTWGSPSGGSYLDEDKFDTTFLRYDGYTSRPHVFTKEKPFAGSFKKDKKTGEITGEHVAFYVDKNGKLHTYFENFPYVTQTKEDFDNLVGSLDDIVRVSQGNKSVSSLKELDWQSFPRSLELEDLSDNAYTVIKGEKGDTVISVNGIKANGLNLVSVSYFKHSNLPQR